MNDTLSARLRSFGDWFTLSSKLRVARAELPRYQGLAARALEQTRLLRDIARQVADPPDELPPGPRGAVLVSLYRDAVYWALVADLADASDPPPNLSSVWNLVPSEKLLRAAGTEGELEVIREVLINLPPSALLEVSEATVARVREFAEALYTEVEAPYRRINRIVMRRWFRWAAAVVAVLAVAAVGRSRARGPNLARGKPIRVSSTQPGCAADERCAALLCHTVLEDNPWVEVDLGVVQPVHAIEVGNRADCCEDRAVPLVAEVSIDRAKWSTVARRDTDFSTWTTTFASTPARYVRVRAPRTTMLHLQDLVIR